MFPRGSSPPAPDRNFVAGSDVAQSPSQFRALDSRIEHKDYVWFGGDHTNVLNVTMGDGSSRAISKDTDLEILEHFVTRQGGESTSLDDL
jgi:hypothetical protein